MTPLQNIAIVAFVVTIFLWIWSFQGRLEQHENHIKKHDEEIEIAVSGYTYSKLESMKEELQFLIDFIDTLETNAELKKD